MIEIDGVQAIATRKTNAEAGWPNRGATADGLGNRVEPFAQPRFEADFNFEAGESIFTIGSCFARNIEQLLEERGYDIPMRALLKRPDLKLSSSGMANNYGVPSILQELRWAVDPDHPFDPATAFLEMSPNRFVDLNLPDALRPEPYDLVFARRAALLDCWRGVSRCRVIVITLGLSEVWFDRLTGNYLNTAPLPRVLERFPDRFCLRVLDVSETVKILEETMRLLRTHAAEGLQVILTVSPVPLSTTFRDQDVMVANTYSKSVLRAAAEEIVAAHDFVHYFPSYESVILSERSVAWRDDQIHPVPDLIALNVNRMVRAFGPPPDELDCEQVLAKLRGMRGSSTASRMAFLLEQAELVPKDLKLLVAAIKVATAARALEQAAVWCDNLPKRVFPYWRETLEADLALVRNDWRMALDLSDEIGTLNAADRNAAPIARTVYRLRMTAHLGTDDIDAALSAALSWSRLESSNTIVPLLRIASHLCATEDYVRATIIFEDVRDHLDAYPISMAEYAEALWHVGRREDAAAAATRVPDDAPSAARLRLRALRSLVSSSVGVIGEPPLGSDAHIVDGEQVIGKT